MKTDAFDYQLPADRIAQQPAEPRDSSRLLVLHRADGRIEHRTFGEIGEYLRAAMRRTLMARIGYVFARQAFARLREKMDVSKSNGGVFLGLNGIVVKSHGGTDEEGFAAAVELAYDMVKSRLQETIGTELTSYHARQPQLASEAAAPSAQE